jgi:FKBP-type peptidyl-prolyl cis-trans isomerase FklB
MFKKFLTITGLACAGITSVVAQEGGAPALTTIDQKAAYIIGSNQAQRLHAQLPDLDVESFVAGIRDALKGEKSKISEEETQKVMQEFQTKMQAAQAEKASAQAGKGKEFLEKNSKREGVTTLPSGLQYEVIKKGEGAKPTADQEVKVHYHGTLIDGSVFDSSVERGEPAEFGVGQVIKGWTEALQLMPVGSKWKLFIPANLAYGDQAPSPKIPGGSALVFEVELLAIKDGKEAK